MKLIITLMVLSLSSSVFAEGAWELKCTSKEGISLLVSNGISELEVHSDDGRSSSVSSVIVEDYDNGVGAGLIVKWDGDKNILSDTIENTEGHDLAKTIFKQQIKIQNFGTTLVSTEVTCVDSVVTSSGSDEIFLLNEQI